MSNNSERTEGKPLGLRKSLEERKKLVDMTTSEQKELLIETTGDDIEDAINLVVAAESLSSCKYSKNASSIQPRKDRLIKEYFSRSTEEGSALRSCA